VRQIMEIERCALTLLTRTFYNSPSGSGTMAQGLERFLADSQGDAVWTLRDLEDLDPDGDGMLGQEWAEAKREAQEGDHLAFELGEKHADRACYRLMGNIILHRENVARKEIAFDDEWSPGSRRTIRVGHEWTIGLGGGIAVTTSLAAAVVAYHMDQMEALAKRMSD